MRAGYICTNFSLPREKGSPVIIKSFSFLLIHNTYGPIIFDSGAPSEAESFKAQLKEQFGITPEDINWLFNTHLHPDHIGCNRLCTNAKVFFSGTDFEYTHKMVEIAYNDGDLLTYLQNLTGDYKNSITEFDAERIRYFIKTYYPPDQFRTLMGVRDNRALVMEQGAEIPDFITVIRTPGHTVGSLSYKISCGPADFYVTGDAVSNRYAFLSGIKETPRESAMDREKYGESLKMLAQCKGYIVPGHDRPFNSRSLKSIRKCPFELEDLFLE